MTRRDYVRGQMSKLIYKACKASQWATARQTGTCEGSADDRRDGFIHFSTAGQLAATLAKHFAGQNDLILLAVNADDLGDRLKWEKSRGGDLFPHLYDLLAVSDVQKVYDLPLGSDGHLLPELETG